MPLVQSGLLGSRVLGPASGPPGLHLYSFGEVIPLAQRRSKGSTLSLAGLGSHGPAKPEERRPRCWEAMQSGSRLVLHWDLTGLRPPTWAQASLLPTPNLRGGVGFQNHQQSLACFLTRGDTEASSLDSQDSGTTQREMFRFLPLALGRILPRQALGSRLLGTRRRKGRSLLMWYHLSFVQDFFKW